jgi:uncharacterized membrane protein YhaH (DUF805 family)
MRGLLAGLAAFFRTRWLAEMPTRRVPRPSTQEATMHWYLEVLKKYALFDGRARRSEYWYFVLFNVAIAIGLGLVDAMIRSITGIGFGPLGTVYALAVLVPGIAVSIRRLHDTDRSGWWLLLGLVPLVGLVLILFMVQDSTASSNRYGQNPKLAIA